jgi:hypothetical protein
LELKYHAFLTGGMAGGGLGEEVLRNGLEGYEGGCFYDCNDFIFSGIKAVCGVSMNVSFVYVAISHNGCAGYAGKFFLGILRGKVRILATRLDLRAVHTHYLVAKKPTPCDPYKVGTLTSTQIVTCKLNCP